MKIRTNFSKIANSSRCVGNQEYTANLAAVYSRKEIDIILEIDDDSTGPIWIGGQDLDTDNVWHWIEGVDGANQEISYFRWATIDGEPQMNSDTNCMAIKRNSDTNLHGHMHSRTCTENWEGGPFACQIRLPDITCDDNPCQNQGVCISIGHAFSCNCLAGFIGDLCQINLPTYQLFTEQKTWEDARDACVALGNGYSLAAITSSMEEDIIDSISTTAWIGANDKNSEGLFLWIQGPNRVNEEIVYSNWASGEPNDYENGIPGEDCTQRRSSGLWNDMPCSTLSPYICQYREGL